MFFIERALDSPVTHEVKTFWELRTALIRSPNRIRDADLLLGMISIKRLGDGGPSFTCDGTLDTF